MQIDFKVLEQALAPIEEIGQGELTFDMGGTSVTMRVLLPPEEREVQKYASQAMEGGKEDDPTSATDYIDRFRIAVLSHAVIEVGGQDFRDTKFVTTGENLENGQPVKVPLVKALRLLVGRWSRPLLIRAYSKYVELLTQVESQAEKAIIFAPSDQDTEIERLEGRLAELRKVKEEAGQKFRDDLSTKVHAVAEVGEIQNARSQPDLQEYQDDEEYDDEVPSQPAPHRTGPISPQRAAPPMERPLQTVRQPPTQPQMASSFINADDDDSADVAMAAEHQRLIEMRQRAAQGWQPLDEGSALERVHPQLNPPPRRRPPHQDAADTERELGLVDAAAQQAQHLGNTPEGVPVFRMPVQDLDVPGAKVRPDKGALDPMTDAGGSKNPRFQPPRKP